MPARLASDCRLLLGGAVADRLRRQRLPRKVVLPEDSTSWLAWDDATPLQFPHQWSGRDRVLRQCGRNKALPEGASMPFQPLMDAYSRARRKADRQAAEFAIHSELLRYPAMLEEIQARIVDEFDVASVPDEFLSTNGIAELIVREVFTKRTLTKGNVRKTLIFRKYKSLQALRRFAINRLKHVIMTHRAKPGNKAYSTDPTVLNELPSSASVRETIRKRALRDQFSDEFIRRLELAPIDCRDKLLYCFHKLPSHDDNRNCAELKLKLLNILDWQKIVGLTRYQTAIQEAIVLLVSPKRWGANTKLAGLIHLAPQTITQAAGRAATYLDPLLEESHLHAQREARRQAEDLDIPE